MPMHLDRPSSCFGAILSLISISTQLTGQVVLTLGTVALIAFLEVLDNVRDVKKALKQRLSR